MPSRASAAPIIDLVLCGGAWSCTAHFRRPSIIDLLPPLTPSFLSGPGPRSKKNESMVSESWAERLRMTVCEWRTLAKRCDCWRKQERWEWRGSSKLVSACWMFFWGIFYLSSDTLSRSFLDFFHWEGSFAFEDCRKNKMIQLVD